VTRTLVVLRHAKSDWSGGEPDRERPLARRGRRQAPEAGAWLAANLGRLDLALVSPAERARQTWRLVSAELADPPESRVDERVYGASGAGLLAVVAGLPERAATVALVGHNPAVEDLVERLVGSWVRMPTSALAVVRWPGSWSDPNGAVLVAAGRPPG
jgi:phosphohistidine phosphatase